MDEEALENAVRAWVLSASGLADADVYFEDEDGTAKSKPKAAAPYITISLGDLVELAPLQVTDSYDNAAAAGQEMVETVTAIYELPVELQAFTPRTTGGSTARSILSRVQLGLGLSTVRDALNAAGLGLRRRGAIRWVPSVRQAKFEGRAVLELSFQVGGTVEARTGYIATANVTKNVSPS